MLEFKIGEQEYRADKINAFEQLYIVTRLAPVIGKAAPAFAAAPKGEEVNALPALAEAIGAMPKGEQRELICALLQAVQRKEQQGLGWSPVCVDGSIMFADVQENLALMMRLAWQAMKHNLMGFFAALPSDLKDAAQKAASRYTG